MAHPIRTLVALVLTLSVGLACSRTETRTNDSSLRSTTTYAPQNRPDVRGTTGAVSAGHPLAAQAGLSVLKGGGTATDAMIAMVIMTIVDIGIIDEVIREIMGIEEMIVAVEAGVNN